MATDLQKKYEDFKKKKEKPVKAEKKGLKLPLFKKKEKLAVDTLSDTLQKTRKELQKKEKKSFFSRLFPKRHDRKDLVVDARGHLVLKKKKQRLPHRHLLRKYLIKAGLEHIDERKLTKNIFHLAIVLCGIITIALLIYAAYYKTGALNPAIVLGGVWTAVFGALLLVSFLALYVFLDMKIFNRTMALEAVLPDFLQLTSTNISAGMPIDKALWFAVRPSFGILAKEIEEVAKATIAGEDLGKALITFSEKYDSTMLKNSISLLLEGMNAGGEMAELLNKISINIQETRIMRKEMAANVLTYVIFITFATVIAAPFLFGLATTLLKIITGIIGSLNLGDGGGAVGGMTFNFSKDVIKQSDFKIFCIVTLLISSFFSACLISVIRKGDIKQGVKYIPIFMVITVVLYLIAVRILDVLTKGIVG